MPGAPAAQRGPEGVVLGQQRLGVNLVSLMVTLLPIRIIQWYLENDQLHLSVVPSSRPSPIRLARGARAKGKL